MNATLGGLQWLATQPQLNARRNLLISELLTDSTLQSMVMEVRRDHYTLEYFRIPTAATWADLVFITFGDQAHNNRPKGDSTGGMITTLAGPECKDGHVCKMMLLQWKTWKLRRKALGSNDAEVQSMVGSEDMNFRCRVLWSDQRWWTPLTKCPRRFG